MLLDYQLICPGLLTTVPCPAPTAAGGASYGGGYQPHVAPWRSFAVAVMAEAVVVRIRLRIEPDDAESLLGLDEEGLLGH